MAIKATSQITLSSINDVKATYRYHLLQASTLTKPTKPTTRTPATTWSLTEPTYVDGSTNSLYTVDCTVFSDDTFSYSEVSLSSSYEAAKSAYNKANSALTVANQTKTSFTWLVKSGSSSTDFVLTDRVATLVSSAINLGGLVSFTGLDSTAQTKINNVISVAGASDTTIKAWCHATDKTLINGGKIYAKSISADKLSVTSLESIVAKIGGFTIGSTSIYNGSSTLGGAEGVFVGTNGISCGTSFKVTSAGELTTTKGTIGGFTIGATYMYNGSSTLGGAAGVYVGTTGISCGTSFKVTSAGELTTTKGNIGGFTIGTTSMYNGSSTLGGAAGVFVGTNGISCGTSFKVTSAGELTATKGNIGGFTIGTTSIYNGSSTLGGATGVFVGTNGLSCGTSFKVTSGGVLTATHGTIGGFTIDANSMFGGGVGMQSVGGEADVAFWAGNTLPARATFKVFHNGDVHSTGTYLPGGSVTTNVTIRNGQISLSDSDGNYIGLAPSGVSGQFTVDGNLSCMAKMNTQEMQVDTLLTAPNIPQALFVNGYYGLANPTGSDAGWMRTTQQGIIPYATGGESSSIGSSSWRFKNGYFGSLNTSGVIVSGGEVLISTNAQGFRGKSTDGTSVTLAHIGGDDLSKFGWTSYHNDMVGSWYMGGKYTALMANYNQATGTSTQGGTIYLCCNGAAPSDGGLRVLEFTKDASDNYLFRHRSKDVTKGVYLGSTAYRFYKVYTNTAADVSSDRTLKENINYIGNTVSNQRAVMANDLTISDMYDFVKDDLSLARFNYIDSTDKEIGFIAQDMLYNTDGTDSKIGQYIVDPTTARDNDSTLSYNTGNYTSVLAGALKKAIIEIELLKEELKQNKIIGGNN